MRVVIQRVSEARVEVNQTIVGQIKQGLMILVGIEHEDNQEDIDWLVHKIIGLRIFNDSEHQMNLSVQDIAGEIIVVSQFTLHASTKKGNRPSFINAAKPTAAKAIYEDFVKTLEYSFQKPIQTGIFGADMQLFLCNDGPVTIFIDSKNKS